LTALDCKVISIHNYLILYLVFITNSNTILVGFRKREVKTVVKTESIREQIEIEIKIEKESKKELKATKDRLD